MDLKEVKSIIDLMKRSDLVEFEIEEASFKLRIKRESNSNRSGGCTNPPFMVDHTPSMHNQHSMPPFAHPNHLTPTAAAPAVGQGVDADGANVVFVKSPMVGTFYSASSPESAPFVQKGNIVKDNTVVCIIEAMKVMNEIQSEVSGTIVEVLVQNGQSVEFGQPLFKVKQ